MRKRTAALIAGIFLLHACVSTRQPQEPPARSIGTASWYGQEFAGRTTANGEIFDPLLLTAAHRTLPFGTVVEVKNPKNGRSVQVRINDRGPFVGDRLIDLSYAAAEKIGLVEEGVGQVELAVVKLGAGEREPPKPYVVTIGEPAAVNPPSAAPDVPFPLPPSATEPSHGTVKTTDQSGFNVEVVEERGGKPVRKETDASGTKIVTKEIPPSANASAVPPPAPPATQKLVAPPAPRVLHGYVLQLGAFQVEKNAEEFRSKVAAADNSVFIDHTSDLYRVRVGPFATRAAAIDAKERLESAGFASIMLSLD